MGPVSVVIADDHRLVRESLISVLESSGRCRVIGETGDGLEALALIQRLRPQVAVVDISMPGLSGLEVVRRLAQSTIKIRCLVLTMHEEEEYVLRVVRAGAAGYLRKDSPARELIDAICTIAAGRTHFDAHAARILAEQIQHPERSQTDPYGDLTAREREVFHLIVEGLSTKEIARRLEISVKTAENHRAKVMGKLGARNSADVVRFAARKGLIAEPPEP